MKYLLYLFLALFIISEQTMAQRAEFNKSNMQYGRDDVFQSARILALGGSGIAGGEALSALSLNPALAASAESGIALNGGLMLNKVEEDRSFPYYDSFVGFNDYGSFAFNNHWYRQFYGNIVWRVPLDMVQNLTVSAGYLPFKDFNYDYEEEIRDPFDKSDKLLGYNRIGHEGSLNQIPVAVAFNPLTNLSLGLQVAMLSGEIDSTMTIAPKATNLLDIERRDVLKKEIDNTPLLAAVGVKYAWNERLAVGATVRMPYTIDLKKTFTTSLGDSLAETSFQSFKYPMKLGAGIEYRFQNILEARLQLDFSYELWSQFEDNLNPDLDFQDTYTINTGIEHIFFDKVPFRIGFLFSTMRESKDFSRSILTIGTGYEVGRLRIDLAGGVSGLEYYQNDLFPDSLYGLSDRSDSDRVKVNEYFARVDFNYFFGN